MGVLRQDVREEVIGLLKQRFQFKERGDWFRQGTCPDCGKKELYAHATDPWSVICGRLNKCAYESDVKSLFPEAFENFNKRFPANDDDPNATADAYMHHARGFPIKEIKGWYRQGKYWNPNAESSRQGTATVLFDIDKENGIAMERFIETVTVIDPRDGSKDVRRANFIGSHRGLWWVPPGLEIKKHSEIWIVEGIIDAIALNLSGIKAVAILSAGNFPAKMLEKLDKSVKLVWALDDDKAGRSYTKRHHKRAVEMGFESSAAILHTNSKDKVDWNDAYQRGWLNAKNGEVKGPRDRNIKNYRYHGEQLLAPSPFEKGISTWRYLCKNEFALTFNKKVYWFNLDVDKFTKEINNDEGSGTEQERRERAARNSGAVFEISNCHFQFLYFLKSEHTDESWYYAKVDFPHGRHIIKNTFTGAQVASASEFKKRLLSIAPGALFQGNGKQLDWIVRRHLTDIKIVQTVDFIGYAKEHGAYIFNDIAIKDGQVYKINEEDFFEVGKLSIKSLLESLVFEIGEKKHYSEKWKDHVWNAYREKGMVAVAFFIGTLFAEQIRARHKSFPFLEIVGEPGTGKSTLIEFAWKLLGRDDYEGFDPNKSTNAGRARNFSQVANMPVCLIESDREDSAKAKQFDWDELKTAYNGRASRSRGVKNAGHDTSESPFRGSILISQNAAVDASQAIMERICALDFKVAEQSPETKIAADALATLPVEQLSYFLIKVCTQEKAVLDIFNKKAIEYEQQIFALPDIKLYRIAKNYGQLRALVDAMAMLIDLNPEQKQIIHQYLTDAAVERQHAIGADPKELNEFWEAFDYMTTIDKTLNHARNEDPDRPTEIYLNPNQVQKRAFELHQNIPPMNELKKMLKDGKRWKFITIKAVNSPHQRLNGDVWTLKCWCFARNPD